MPIDPGTAACASGVSGDIYAQWAADTSNNSWTTPASQAASIRSLIFNIVQPFAARINATIGSVSVKDPQFAAGAKGDGVADDTAAVTAALLYLSVNGGGTLLFPAGTYLISGPLSVPANVVLTGVGKRATVLRKAANFDFCTLADGAGLASLTIDGQGATCSGRGAVMSGADGRQSGFQLRMINMDGACLDFGFLAGSQSSWINCELSRLNAATGTNRYAISVRPGASGSVLSGSTPSVVLCAIGDTTNPSGWYDGASVELTSGAMTGTVATIFSSASNGGGNWTLTLSAPLPGAPIFSDAVVLLVNQAVPRKFLHIETSGRCAFAFGASNDCLVACSFLGDLQFDPQGQTRGLQFTGNRVANQASLSIRGFNISMCANDFAPQLIVMAGSQHVTIKGNTYNIEPTLDLTGRPDVNEIEGAVASYAAQLLSASGIAAVGDGVMNASYARAGRAITLQVDFTVGIHTVFGLGTEETRISIPAAPPVTAHVQVGSGYCQQGSVIFMLTAVLATPLTYVVLRTTSGPANPVSPFTWGTGDVLRFSLTYLL